MPSIADAGQQLQARQNIVCWAIGVAAGLVAAITRLLSGLQRPVQGGKADTALQSADLAPVAFSSAYSALTGCQLYPVLSSSSTPASPTTGGTAGTANVAARATTHPLPTSAQITDGCADRPCRSGSASGGAAAELPAPQALAKHPWQANGKRIRISVRTAGCCAG